MMSLTKAMRIIKIFIVLYCFKLQHSFILNWFRCRNRGFSKYWGQVHQKHATVQRRQRRLPFGLQIRSEAKRYQPTVLGNAATRRCWNTSHGKASNEHYAGAELDSFTVPNTGFALTGPRPTLVYWVPWNETSSAEQMEWWWRETDTRSTIIWYFTSTQKKEIMTAKEESVICVFSGECFFFL